MVKIDRSFRAFTRNTHSRKRINSNIYALPNPPPSVDWIRIGLSTSKRAKWLVLLGPSKRQERCLTYGETTACNDSWKALLEIRPFSKKSSALSRSWASSESGYNAVGDRADDRCANPTLFLHYSIRDLGNAGCKDNYWHCVCVQKEESKTEAHIVIMNSLSVWF